MPGSVLQQWGLDAASVSTVSEVQQYTPYQQQSLPLLSGSGKQEGASTGQSSLKEDGRPMQLFGAVDLASAPGPRPAKKQKVASSGDIALFAGGPVWALSWCPGSWDAEEAAGPLDPQNGGQYLALGVHPVGQQRNVINKPTAGPGILQVWQLDAAGASAGEAALPRLAYGVCHGGGVMWDCKWCPSSGAGGCEPATACLSRLGFLAMVLGSGHLQVACLPQPHALPAAPDGRGAVPLLLRVPAAVAGPERLSGALPSTVEWLPSPPHDLLLLGCWDGTAAVYQLRAAAQGGSSAVPRLELLLHCRADSLPLRAVAWLPPALAAAGGGLAGRHTFLTAGHSGATKIWDARDPAAPAVAVVGSRAHILDCAWQGAPHGAFLALDDGSLRCAVLDRGPLDKRAAILATVAPSRASGAVWSVSVCEANGLLAWSGEDGSVYLTSRQAPWQNPRSRPSPQLWSGVRREAGGLRLLSCADLSAAGAPNHMPLKKAKASKAAETVGVPDVLEPVHRVRWGPAAADGSVWLAQGGAAGIVRCQRVLHHHA